MKTLKPEITNSLNHYSKPGINLNFFKIVRDKQVFVVERFGYFRKIIYPGYNFILPLIDNVSSCIHLNEMMIESQCPEFSLITYDKYNVEVESVVFIKITNPEKINSEHSTYEEKIRNLIRTYESNEISKVTFDTLIQDRESVVSTITIQLSNSLKEYGFELIRYNISCFKLLKSTKSMLASHFEAEKSKKKEIILSEAKKISEINKAEAEKRAQIIIAEGTSEGIDFISNKDAKGFEIVAEALGDDPGSFRFLLLKKYLDILNELYERSDPTTYISKKGEINSKDDLFKISDSLNNKNENIVENLLKTVQNGNEKKNVGPLSRLYDDVTLIKELKNLHPRDDILNSSDDEKEVPKNPETLHSKMKSISLELSQKKAKFFDYFKNKQNQFKQDCKQPNLCCKYQWLVRRIRQLKLRFSIANNFFFYKQSLTYLIKSQHQIIIY